LLKQTLHTLLHQIAVTRSLCDSQSSILRMVRILTDSLHFQSNPWTSSKLVQHNLTNPIHVSSFNITECTSF
jgi:hypothetical protein